MIQHGRGMCLAVGTASKNHHHFAIQSQESNVNPGCHPLFFCYCVGLWGGLFVYFELLQTVK